MAGRADRAAKNMVVGMLLFLTAAVLAAQLAGKGAQAASSAPRCSSGRGSSIGRSYLAGIAYLRTGVWTVSVIGLTMIVAEVW